MTWSKVRTDSLTGPDGQEWHIDLLGGETRFIDPSTGNVLPRLTAGNSQDGVEAACYKEEVRQFDVKAWVLPAQVAAAQNAVMKEARRRIQQGEWAASESYELEAHR